MRFIFLPAGTIPVHANILSERPLGGTETGIVRLAEALAILGHDVRVFTDYENPPLTNPLYLPRKALSTVLETDVLVTVRQWQASFNHIRAKTRLFWTGDAFDQPQTLGLGDKRVVDHFDALLTVSNWQADTLSSVSGFPRKKCWLIKNGIHPSYFTSLPDHRDPFRLVFTPTPYRGLDQLLKLFPLIKAQIPEATLHIFSDYDVYRDATGKMAAGYEANARRHEQLRVSASTQPGVLFRGNMKQADLASELLQGSIFAYPNTFAETSCISVLEAMAAGCVPVATRRGALPETIGSAGVLITGEPGETKHDQAFVSAVIQLLSDRKEWQTYSTKAREQAMAQSWEAVAANLLKKFPA